MAVNSFIFSSKRARRFAAKALLFLLLLTGVDWLLGSAIDSVFRRTLYGENWPKENWLLSQKFDVVIFGSSRAFRSYIPSIIERQVPGKVFNAGANGQYLLYAYTLEQMLLDSHPPRIIVLDLLPNDVTSAEPVKQEVERLSILAPFAGHPQVREMLTQGSLLEDLKLRSRLYRYNSRLLSIADNYSKTPGEFDQGYISVGKTRFREVNRFLDDLSTTAAPAFDAYRIGILKKFIQSARDKGAKVVLVFSPPVEPLSAKVRQILDYLTSLAADQGVPFLIFTCEAYPQFHNREWYMDYIHMNALGAEAFSPLFAGRLAGLMAEGGGKP